MKFLYKLKLFFYIVIILIGFASCSINVESNNPNKFKYTIKTGTGFKEEYWYSLSELKYESNGCVKFLGFSYGKIDTTVICGSYVVEPY